MSRASFNTPSQKQQVYYSDFPNSFAKHPVTNELTRITNEAAVMQEMRNLILTNLGEFPFRPNIGSNVTRQLFELDSPLTSQNLSTYIKDTVQYSMSDRVTLLAVSVSDSSTQLPTVVQTGDNSLVATVVFTVSQNPKPITLSMILSRVR